MDLPILLSVCVTKIVLLLEIFMNCVVIFTFFLFSMLSENVNIHVKVFPKAEIREGKEYARIERVRAKFTTTK